MKYPLSVLTALACAAINSGTSLADTIEYQFNDSDVLNITVEPVSNGLDWFTIVSEVVSTSVLPDGIQQISYRYYDESQEEYSAWIRMPFYNRNIKSGATFNSIMSADTSVTDVNEFTLSESLSVQSNTMPGVVDVNRRIMLTGTEPGVAKLTVNVTDDITLQPASISLPFRLFSQRTDGLQFNQIARVQTQSGADVLAAVDLGVDSGTTWQRVEMDIPITSLTNLMTLNHFATDVTTETSNTLVDIVVLPDADNDGTPDSVDAFPQDPEEQLDTDGDGIGNNADADDDGDGMPDEYELANGLDPLNAEDAGLDNDGDGASNLAEYQAGTDPNDADSVPIKRIVALDYDGDGVSDIAVRRAETFFQYIRNSKDDSITREVFGKDASDIPIYGDFDGDGKTDIGVRRASNYTWYILNSSGVDHITGNEDGITRRRFGRDAGDIPVPADYDGDGITDIAVRRASSQFWYILNSSGVDYISSNEDGITRRRFGTQEADIPVPADYDGDGKADLAVRRPSTQLWYVLNSSGEDHISSNDDGVSRKRFGTQEADIPVPADYDGDGKADLAVRRPSTQFWYVLNSSGKDELTDNEDGISRKRFGSEEADIPVVADYDGDGKADLAVRRASTFYWYVYNSSRGNVGSDRGDGIQRRQFGRDVRDIPIGAPIQLRLSALQNGE